MVINTYYGHRTKQHKIPSDAYVLIIGAMKCGTTSLFSYMSMHPSICPSIVKEPGYFSKSQRYFFNEYEDIWLNFNDSKHKYVMEASTNYTKYPLKNNVPENIRSVGINPKFIYIMRNPFDRIISHINHRQSKKKTMIRLTGKHFINVSNYYMQLERYRSLFSVEDILLLDFDELVIDPRNLLCKVYNFLELPLVFPDEYEIKNKSFAISSDLKKVVFMFERFLPKPLRVIFKKKIITLLAKNNNYVLTVEDREYIYRELKESMNALHSVYGVNVQKWGFPI